MGFPVDESLVRDVESQLGRALPPALRLRLLHDNGGTVWTDDDEWTLHPVWDPTDRKRMARTAAHVVRETEQARSWPGFPAGAVSIASDGAGNHLVLRPGSDAVERWDHETGQCSPVTLDWT
jgi:hypothetical protein